MKLRVWFKMLIHVIHITCWFGNPWLRVSGISQHVSRAHFNKHTQCNSFMHLWIQRKWLNLSRHMHSIHQDSLDGPCKLREVQVAEFHCSILGLLSCLCGKATLLPSRAITRKLKMLYQWHFSGLPQEHRNLPLISTHMHRRTHTHTHTHKTKTNCASSFGLGVNINFYQRGLQSRPVASQQGDR